MSADMSIDGADSPLEAIQAAIDGDDGAFDDVVRLYATRLRWLIRMRLDPALRVRVSADDILQETLLTASKRIESLVVRDERAFWRWLCSVVEQRLADAARRHLLAAKRDARREQRQAPGPVAAAASDGSTGSRLAWIVDRDRSSPSLHLRHAEQRAGLEAALQRLPESYRRVILLRIVEGLSSREAAEVMGRSEVAVRVLLSKAIRRLGEQLVGADLSGSAAGSPEP